MAVYQSQETLKEENWSDSPQLHCSRNFGAATLCFYYRMLPSTLKRRTSGPSKRHGELWNCLSVLSSERKFETIVIQAEESLSSGWPSLCYGETQGGATIPGL